MKRYKYYLLWIPAIFIMILIFFFSAQNGNTSSETSGGFAEFLAKICYPDFASFSDSKKLSVLSNCQFIVRKAAHFSVYAALGFFCMLPLLPYKNLSFAKRLAASILISAVYALSDEFHQYFVPERSCRITDVLIDTCGALTGAFCFSILVYFIKKIKFQKKSWQIDITGI